MKRPSRSSAKSPLIKDENLVFRKDRETDTLHIMSIIDSRFIYKVDGLAAKIWLHIDGLSTEHEIVELLYQEIGPPSKELLKKDVRDHIKSFKKFGLLLD